MKKREILRKGSNNIFNSNKNVCALEVAKKLGVDEEVRYLHVIEDTLRAARTRFSVRSVKTVCKSKTVGGARKNLVKHNNDALYYIVHVQGHVLLLDSNANTIVDTDPRIRDSRKIRGIYGVYEK